MSSLWICSWSHSGPGAASSFSGGVTRAAWGLGEGACGSLEALCSRRAGRKLTYGSSPENPEAPAVPLLPVPVRERALHPSRWKCDPERRLQGLV